MKTSVKFIKVRPKDKKDRDYYLITKTPNGKKIAFEVEGIK